MGDFVASEIPPLSSILYLFGEQEIGPYGFFFLVLSITTRWFCDSHRRHSQAGSLTGAVHLSNNNVGVLRLAQRG